MHRNSGSMASENGETPLFVEGESVECCWEDGHYYRAVIEYETEKGWWITYPEYKSSHEVTSDRLRRAPPLPITPASPRIAPTPSPRPIRSPSPLPSSSSSNNLASMISPSTSTSSNPTHSLSPSWSANSSNSNSRRNSANTNPSTTTTTSTPSTTWGNSVNSTSSLAWQSLSNGSSLNLNLMTEQEANEIATRPHADSDDDSTVSEPAAPEPVPVLPYAGLEQTKRNQVAIEIVETEKSYVESLQVLVELYLHPLTKLSTEFNEKNKKDAIIKPSQVTDLFSNTELIYTLNTSFCKNLTERLTTWLNLSEAEQKIGDLFLEFAPYFKMYSQYCSTFEAASKLLEKLTTDRTFENFQSYITSVLSNPRCKGRSLSSFLIMPIQRVPRYKLLLEELLKRTDAKHTDYPAIEQALQQISVVASHINEAVRRRENNEAIVAIEQQFISNPQFVNASRIFIRQGSLIKKCRSADKKYEFFLFNNMLAYASYVGWKYKLNRKIDIDHAFKVSDVATKPGAYGEHRILIESSQKSFLVFCKDAAEKDSWTRDLKKVQQAASGTIQAGAAKAAVLLETDVPTRCSGCEKPFTLLLRRHHCKKCGRQVCGDCSRSKLVLEGLLDKDGKYDRQPKRVCNQCATGVTTETVTQQVLIPKDTPLSQWNVKHIIAWLSSDEIGLSQYVTAFEEFKVDGTILMQMTDDDLKNDIKIAEGLIRKRLLNSIQKLAQQTVQAQQVADIQAQTRAIALMEATAPVKIGAGSAQPQLVKQSSLQIPTRTVSSPGASSPSSAPSTPTSSSSTLQSKDTAAPPLPARNPQKQILDKMERERMEKEQRAAAEKEKEIQKKLEKEREAREKQERMEKAAREKLEKEQELQREKLEKEKEAQQRLNKEKQERERLERLEKERAIAVEREKEQMRLAQEQQKAAAAAQQQSQSQSSSTNASRYARIPDPNGAPKPSRAHKINTSNPASPSFTAMSPSFSPSSFSPITGMSALDLSTPPSSPYKSLPPSLNQDLTNLSLAKEEGRVRKPTLPPRRHPVHTSGTTPTSKPGGKLDQAIQQQKGGSSAPSSSSLLSSGSPASPSSPNNLSPRSASRNPFSTSNTNTKSNQSTSSPNNPFKDEKKESTPSMTSQVASAATSALTSSLSKISSFFSSSKKEDDKEKEKEKDTSTSYSKPLPATPASLLTSSAPPPEKKSRGRVGNLTTANINNSTPTLAAATTPVNRNRSSAVQEWGKTTETTKPSDPPKPLAANRFESTKPTPLNTQTSSKSFGSTSTPTASTPTNSIKSNPFLTGTATSSSSSTSTSKTTTSSFTSTSTSTSTSKPSLPDRSPPTKPTPSTTSIISKTTTTITSSSSTSSSTSSNKGKFCTNCGAGNQTGKFCVSCGAKRE